MYNSFIELNKFIPFDQIFRMLKNLVQPVYISLGGDIATNNFDQSPHSTQIIKIFEAFANEKHDEVNTIGTNTNYYIEMTKKLQHWRTTIDKLKQDDLVVSSYALTSSDHDHTFISGV